MLTVTTAPTKVKNAFKNSKDKKFHWSFQIDGESHILCIKITSKDRNSNDLYKCRILDCDCEYLETQHTYRCKYYSRIEINIKKNDLIYPCGCGKAMWNVLDAMLKTNKK
ncbi:hypothetical protein CMI47_13020 [Candidatus Pacearchaeota archaeon]|nr:hypothetical protein [Candidatus Pacearchaeota archaeon]